MPAMTHYVMTAEGALSGHSLEWIRCYSADHWALNPK
jgi:hypothetical protein